MNILKFKELVRDRGLQNTQVDPISCIQVLRVEFSQSILETPQTIRKGGESGPAVIPGKPTESLMLQLASHQKRPLMPPKMEVPLTPEELALIKLWIDQGAKAPTGARVRATVTLHAPPATVHPVRAVAISSADGVP